MPRRAERAEPLDTGPVIYVDGIQDEQRNYHPIHVDGITKPRLQLDGAQYYFQRDHEDGTPIYQRER